MSRWKRVKQEHDSTIIILLYFIQLPLINSISRNGAEWFICRVSSNLQLRTNSNKVNSVLRLFPAELTGWHHIILVKPSKLACMVYVPLRV